MRLRQLGLRPVDVGFEQFLISYMVIPIITYSLDNNREWFTESNTENPWTEYINKSMRGTWYDSLFVQAVVDSGVSLKNLTHPLCTASL